MSPTDARNGAASEPSWIVHVDGASRGNPGPAAAGIAMYRDGELFRTIGQTLGTLTNNQAEYRALLLALRALAVYAARQVEICMDSQLVVMQVQGKYRVRDHGLQALHAEALTLLAKAGNPRFTYVPRERNAIADRMANLALNGEPIDAEISQHAPGTGDANATTA